jgi:SH3-like domain-containing protein
MAFSPNFLSQRDPKWRGETLGFDTSLTLGSDGCALTCLAMLVNGYGFEENPSTLNAKLKALGPGVGFLGGLIVWGGLSRVFPKITFQRIVICRDQPAPLQAIDQALDSGQPLVVEIDSSPAAGLQNHWVVLYGRQSGDYLMLDPYPYPADNRAITLGERYAKGRSPAEYITAVVWYQAIGLGPEPTPGAGLTVRIPETVSAGLRVRAAPTTTSATLTIEPAGSLLKCLEPESVARPKVGVYDQWLRVSTTDGVEGYVAAWYVEIVERPAPAAPQPTPAAAPESVSPPATPPPAPPPSPEPAPAPQPEPSLPAEPLIASVVLNVGTRGLRVRAQPSLAGGYVTVVKAGRQVTLLDPPQEARARVGKAGQWLRVRTVDGKEGYVQAQYLTLGDAAAEAAAPAPAVLTVVVSGLVGAGGIRLRAGPSTDTAMLKIIAAGTSLTVLETAAAAEAKIGIYGQWLKVRDPQGSEGYVAAWYVQKT